MRFWITLALVLGIGAFSVKTCAGSFFGGKTEKEKKQQSDAQKTPPDPSTAQSATSAVAALVPVPSPAGSVDTVTPSLSVEKPASMVYVFRHREPPENLQTLSTLGVVAVVDRPSRTVIVHGPPASVDASAAFLQAVDTVGSSCSVQTWAVYVDRSVQKGFDLAAAISSVSNVDTALSVRGGALTLDASAGDVAVALNAIADGSTVEVIQRPHVRLTHGIPARIESTQEFPIPQTTLSNGIAQTAISYRKVGLQLEVIPYFLQQDSVRLSVKQSNGLIGNTVEIEGNAVPVIQSQTVETTAELTIGQTIILGGVQTSREKVTRGLIRNTREITEGALYVILSTFSEIPKAQPVGSPLLESPNQSGVPFTTPLEDGKDWIDGQLLPAKGWERQERDFLRSYRRRGGQK